MRLSYFLCQNVAKCFSFMHGKLQTITCSDKKLWSFKAQKMGQILCVKKVPFHKSGYIYGLHAHTSQLHAVVCIWLFASRHTVVCNAAQGAITSHHDILRWRQRMWFSHLCSSEIRIQPNLLQICLWTRRIYVTNLKQIASANPEIQASKVSK